MWFKNLPDSDGILGLNKSPFEYFSILRRLRRFLIHRGIGYQKLEEDQNDFELQAMKSSPFLFRWFGDSLSFNELSESLRNSPDLSAYISKYETGDKIWPFVINPHTSAMRKGYVIVRSNKPITALIIIMS